MTRINRPLEPGTELSEADALAMDTALLHDLEPEAARLYDRQLNDRARATPIYKEIITHETNERYIEEAQARLKEISNRR